MDKDEKKDEQNQNNILVAVVILVNLSMHVNPAPDLLTLKPKTANAP